MHDAAPHHGRRGSASWSPRRRLRGGLRGANDAKIPNTKYTCCAGQTRNKLLEQRVHLTNRTAGRCRPGATDPVAARPVDVDRGTPDIAPMSTTIMPRAPQRSREQPRQPLQRFSSRHTRTRKDLIHSPQSSYASPQRATSPGSACEGVAAPHPPTHARTHAHQCRQGPPPHGRHCERTRRRHRRSRSPTHPTARGDTSPDGHDSVRTIHARELEVTSITAHKQILHKSSQTRRHKHTHAHTHKTVQFSQQPHSRTDLGHSALPHHSAAPATAAAAGPAALRAAARAPPHTPRHLEPPPPRPPPPRRCCSLRP